MYNRILLGAGGNLSFTDFPYWSLTDIVFHGRKVGDTREFCKSRKNKNKAPHRFTMPPHFKKHFFCKFASGKLGRTEKAFYLLNNVLRRPHPFAVIRLPVYLFHNETPSVSTAPNSAGYSSVSTIWKDVNISAPLLPLFPYSLRLS